jgi:lysophospholipase L1-like esterase
MDTIRYLALGDSIATGTLTFWVKTKSYAHYFYDLIQKNEPTAKIQYTNLAADGDTSLMFLYKLNHWPYLQQKIKKADIITLSIGGNDIMRGANIPGFCRINWPLVKSSSLSFCTNWEKIIRRLRELNPHCRILVNTLYNPYNETSSLRPWQRMDTGLHEAVQKYIDRINNFLAQKQEGLYEIAPVYDEFLKYRQGKMGHMVCMYPDDGAYLFRNPHPTGRGHQRIAQICAGILW